MPNVSFCGFLLLTLAFVFIVLRLEKSMPIAEVLQRLQDTTAQIRVRGAFMLLIAFAALAEGLGLEVILGAFIAGVILRAVDRDIMMTHPYRPLVGTRRASIAGLLQATSLTFIVAASQIGMELGLITKATGAALIAAGLLSVLIFPLCALTLLRQQELPIIDASGNENVS